MASTSRPATVSHKKGQRHEWKEGEIAYLKPASEFKAEDYRSCIESEEVEEGATGHPVIVLKRRSPAATHVIVTPVTAFCSGPENHFLPPWKQPWHARKARDDFRAFLGCARPTDKRAHLLLEAGSMPKPKTSWVYVQSVYLVPVWTLRFFTKVDVVLRMKQESFADLRSHIYERSPTKIGRLLNDPRLRLEFKRPAAAAAVNAAQPVSARRQTWGFLDQQDRPRSAASTSSGAVSSVPSLASSGASTAPSSRPSTPASSPPGSPVLKASTPAVPYKSAPIPATPLYSSVVKGRAIRAVG
ncbi:hypothetical protein DL766_006609 [Monosporascus sp. MC13-8B]|uniref:Uncharacterized protein n=1 Tax=Monosporascus cannonballus TaxID=155416 RepID=A0ABY0HEV8_9PEZI|nr:hypothetical protein DL762_001932 [Monosporascus cannonballus]RYO91978.1 hypothetical protein DL763_004822 [Monosporascus cannonballus]RYP26803.1 hypothetical protein DL766_006609 [Monosporascus sp. MC13-8B]